MAIEDNIRAGVELTTKRKVLADNVLIDSRRYSVKDEYGFRIAISHGSHINISWSMLEKCYRELSSESGYSREAFRTHFPVQLNDHSCYVHVVGEVFVRAGLAKKEGRIYRLTMDCKG